MRIPRFIYKDWFLGIFLTVLVLGAFTLELFPFQSLEYAAYDLLSRFRHQGDTEEVVIVAIDDKSIQSLGRWPWPREQVAGMVSRLSGYGARVVGLDVLYPEHEYNPGLEEIRKLRRELKGKKGAQARGLYKSLREAESRIDSDSRLLKAVRASGDVVLPMIFIPGSPDGEKDKGKTPRFLNANSTVLKEPPRDVKLALRELRNPVEYVKTRPLRAVGVIHPFDRLAGAAAALGHLNSLADLDGVVRSQPLFINYRDRSYPSFALQVALEYMGRNVGEIKRYDAGGLQGVRIKGSRIPLGADYGMLIGYSGEDAFPVFSFSDVLDDAVPAAAFKGKAVLVGLAFSGAMSYDTPSGAALPGTQVAANVVRNIIKGTYLARPAWAFGLEVAVILYFGIIVILVLPRVKLRVGALIMALSLLPWLGVAAFFYIASGYWIKAASSAFFLVGGYCITAARRLLTAGRFELTAENIESSKMLGLTFQNQGMLDMAFEKFMKCPVEDVSVRELLYNLGLDFERKRMPGKARAVYEHISRAGKFKDVREKIKALQDASEGMLIAPGASRKDSTVLLTGTNTNPTLGRYEVIRELGRGAMGTVYLGKDPKINREVAIKTLVYEEVDEEQLGEVKKRFFQEAEAAGKLSHPNIMTIYDAGEEHDIAYMAMELLEGKDLSEHCQKGNLLPPKEVMRIVADVANALDYAHKNGVVHRDIKPANIMVLTDGTVKVTDFGIARVVESSKTHTGMILGTPGYMSPEQVAGERVEGTSDLFSLGVVFYELLSGEKAFKGESIAAIMYNISKVSYTPLKKVAKKVPDCCHEIVSKLLSKSIRRRYKTGEEVAREVNRCMERQG